MNPFKEKVPPLDKNYIAFSDLYPHSYNDDDISPYSKLRIILMNGTEFEADWFLHRLSRCCQSEELRREIACIRFQEQQQQKRLAVLKPIKETILEHTIGYEHLAVDLTAILAQREPDEHVKKALDFALLEDFDHLYRYADLLEMDKGIKAEELIGRYAEIMPGRPTIAEHRHPADNIRKYVDFSKAKPITKLNIGIIIAAEQQTMNYYMNVAGFYGNDMGRRLYQEIALVEEEHVSHYESLTDPNCTWLEALMEHEYTEYYLYRSCYEDETDKELKKIWEEHMQMELAHLHKAAELLEKYENTTWQQVMPQAELPQLICFHDNIEYVREIIKTSVSDTNAADEYINVSKLKDDARFFTYQKQIITDAEEIPSHRVIETYIGKNGRDYRYETETHPIKSLADRGKDNIHIGRCRDHKEQ